MANRGYDVGEYEVRVESTIGIYGTGLLDAISDEDLKAEYAKQEQDGYLPTQTSSPTATGRGSMPTPLRVATVRSIPTAIPTP